MKSTLVIALFSIWIFALVTPSVITIIEKSQSTFVFNLTEEEQKENVTWDSDQKQITRQSALLMHLTAAEVGHEDGYSQQTVVNPLFDIVLPPPEALA